jgi:WD40 repeat protein
LVKEFEFLVSIEAHDGEIIALDFAFLGEKLLLASASKDRLVHIFDCTELKFDLVQTLDDHTSAITKMFFCKDRLISCSTDKSIIFRAFDVYTILTRTAVLQNIGTLL